MSDKPDSGTGEEPEPVRAVIRNSAGIHCRPSALIVKEARRYEGADITVSSGAGSADPKSAIDLLSMGLEKGAIVEIRAVGPDAETCCRRLAELFETEFDFPSRRQDESVAER